MRTIKKAIATTLLLSLASTVSAYQLLSTSNNGTAAGQLIVDPSSGNSQTATDVRVRFFDGENCQIGDGGVIDIDIGNHLFNKGATVNVLGEALWSIGNAASRTMQDGMSIRLVQVCKNNTEACNISNANRVFTQSTALLCMNVNCGSGNVCSPSSSINTVSVALQS